MKTRSAWHFDKMGNIIAIYDDFTGTEMSVTNDAEQVIEAIHEAGVDFTGKTVIYRDTDGIWDELVVADNEFKAFRHVGATTLNDAIKLVGEK